MGNPVHATCIEIDGMAVLLRGPPGSGKSDLALRLIDSGARLIADDYTEISVYQGRLIARAPENIRGLIEVRGIGVLNVGSPVQATVGVVIDLVHVDEIERLPEAATTVLMDQALPLFKLSSFQSSTAAKIRLIVRQIKGEIDDANR